MYQAFFANPGGTAFGNLSSGKLNLENSIVSPITKLLTTGSESKFSARSSVLDPSGINKANCSLWINNLSNSVTLNPSGAISRTGWTATASANNGTARNGIDGSANTRWDTQGAQVAGQWYMVDMKTTNTFNEIILDVAGSPSDSPAGYKLYVSNDGITWGSAVASGSGTDGMTTIPIATTTARYFKIEQTGTKGNYWSIHELYVYNVIDDLGTSSKDLELTAETGFNFRVFPNPVISGGIISIQSKTTTSFTIRLFSVNGGLIRSGKIDDERNADIVNYPVGNLNPGIYLLNFESGKTIETRKLIIK